MLRFSGYIEILKQRNCEAELLKSRLPFGTPVFQFVQDSGLTEICDSSPDGSKIVGHLCQEQRRWSGELDCRLGRCEGECQAGRGLVSR